MPQAKTGDKVKVHYTGKLEDGTIFDSSIERETLEFTIGNKELIPGFEEGVIGMNIGDSKTINIPAQQAYGSYNADMVIDVPSTNFPGDMKPEVGMPLHLHQENGQCIHAIITNIKDTIVTLDANHPLAGKDLIFDIQLVEIV